MAVGEIFLAAFLQVLLNRLVSGDFVNFATQKGIGRKLEKWRETLSTIVAVLYDAEEKQLTSKAVELWLDDLKDLAYDVEDILDKFSTKMLRRKVKQRNRAGTSKVRGIFSKVAKVKFNLNMNSEIEEIDDRLLRISQRKSDLGLIYIEPRSTMMGQRLPSSYVLDGPVVGRGEDKKTILEFLFRYHEPSITSFHVVAIVGMPGIGKTTLAGHVFTAVKQFNPKVWVSVSDNFNLERVTKTIYKLVTSQHCDLDEFCQVQDSLREALEGKRFLIVLDDVWTTCDYNSWRSLQSTFHLGAQGSKIIVTTRDKEVAKLMGATEVYDLKTLSDEDCLQVFQQHVNNVKPPSFELTKKIVKNCDGLPLAAKTLGGILRCKETDKWEEVLNDRLWTVCDNSGILPVLKLSYHYLPSSLKRCFAYCSILPNDYEFKKKQLILLWMAEGLLQQSEGSTQMEDIGDNYFVELLSRSLFQNSGKKNSRYVMHDLVGDLARWAAGGTFFRLQDKWDGRCAPRIRHSSYISGLYDGDKKFENVLKFKRLRTFLPLSISQGPQGPQGRQHYLSRKVAFDLVPKLESLRVLSFNGYQITELPDSIGHLKHLRYLDLSHTQISSLPESITTLFNLQTLILKSCSHLKALPTNISNLTNLRHLNNSYVPSLEGMPAQLGQLTNLQTLCKFLVGKGSESGISETLIESSRDIVNFKTAEGE